MRSYAIGDIHGQRALLEEVHALIDADRAATGDAAAPVVHLGDYADRGPDVRGVLDLLIAGRDAGKPWVMLMGNHDRMMERYLREPAEPDPARPDLHWLEPRIGGQETLASYGVDCAPDRAPEAIHAEAREKVPQAHRDFLRDLPAQFHFGPVFYCHAGIRPGVPLGAQRENDLVWIREEFLHARGDHGALIVHGHTPVQTVSHCGNRVNLDTGAAYGGPLSVVVIEGRSVFELTPDGRRPVRSGRAAQAGRPSGLLQRVRSRFRSRNL